MEKQKLKELKQTLQPYKGIILFVVVMFAANVVWKLSISGDETGNAPALLWKHFDISRFFVFFTKQICDITYYILHNWLGMNVKQFDFVLRFETGQSISIIWGCSGIKQVFIFTMIMLFSSGSWKNKLWFIPSGIVICYLINIVRIVMLCLIMYAYPEKVELFHTYIFKYLFYGIIFLIWLVWNEKYGNRKEIWNANTATN